MEVKLAIVVLLAMTLMINVVVADFFFNHPSPKAEDIDGIRYKCVPGRTTIKVTEKQVEMLNQEETDSEEYRLRKGPTRKKHMTVPSEDEYCKICVCSADGKDEYCSNRPAQNVNECLVLKDISDKFNMGLPYEHTRNLANMIRRDYIWHNDEIPYDAKAKCFRGHSYYTNSATANDTDVDVGTDVESLLDYDNQFNCYYCVCSVSGESVGCINRDVSFCNFFRVIRSDKHVRDRYTSLMGQDRPAYFRQLSYRLRRTMDNGIFDMLEAGGDTLCCNHPDGHRRQIHNKVRNKLRTMMRRIPKENLLGQKEMSVKGDYEDFIVNNDFNHVGNVQTKKKCVPYVSEYSNCNEENLCTGCSRCKCEGDGQWACEDVKDCRDDNNDNSPDNNIEEGDEIFDNALQMLEFDVNKKRVVKVSQSPYVPAPQAISEQEGLLAPWNQNLNEFLASLSLSRSRRSTNSKNNKHSKRAVVKPSNMSKNSSHNNTVKNYDTIDEINEETLKDSNLTGTLVAKKIDMTPPLAGSRRSGFTDTTSTALQFEYNQTKAYNQITDNKIETVEQETKFDSSHENLKIVLGNYTQNTKRKDLLKIVVNELKQGSETIGDASATPVSNITFTPENDTLTAMTYIAGNLLNQLWNMEKDAAASSTEIDHLKHEKIADLLELFKEPLNMRQEMFLKNALEQLSNAIDKNKDAKNISICETITESEKLLKNANSTSDEETLAKLPCRKNAKDDNNKLKKNKEEMIIKQKKAKVEMEISQKGATINAIDKIHNVLNLIKKFENIQGNLSELQHGPKLVFNHTPSNNKKHDIYTELTKDEENSFNMFGSLLEKITKLILPKRNNKKIANGIKSQNFLKGNDNLKNKFKKMYNVDITNMTVSAKDKMILDYLTHVDRNPGCLLNNNNHEVEAMPSVEGNILLNLSEFFKLKSFSDLIKLLDPEKANIRKSPNESEKQTVKTTTEEIEENKMSSSIKGVDSYKFNSTKEKLKAHLKTILEDIIEIQNARGVSFKGNIKVADALPCFYNLLKADRTEIVKKEENIDPLKKIANIFQGLKKEMKVAMSRRNTGEIMTERPKSAVVWERLVKNLNEKSHSKTRRSSKSKIPKSYDAIRKMMERIENGSSTYKNHALLVNVPAAGKLILLKALEQDVQAKMNIIDEIKLSFDNLTKLPREQFSELEEFVQNMEMGLKLSEKVSEKVNEKVKPDLRKLFVTEMNSGDKMLKTTLKKKPILKAGDPREETDEVKITRIQIVNQLIKNRMVMFLKLKEDRESDIKHDMTYNIAQRILYYLDTGNYKLAYELFRIFVKQKQNDKNFVSSTPKLNEIPMRRMVLHQKEAPVLLEDPTKLKTKHMTWVAQDHLIKELLNIKNAGL